MIGWSGRSEQRAAARISPALLPPVAALGQRDLKLEDGAEGHEAERARVYRESEYIRVLTCFYG